jgi:hypothetical protein
MENEIPNPGRLGWHEFQNEVKIMKEKFGESEK